MRLMRRLAALAGAAALAASCAFAAAKKEEPAIWTIQKPNGTTITLFGSVHLLPEGDAWRTKALTDAYAAADVIVLETDVGELSTREMRTYLSKHSLNAPGVTLTRLLSAEDKATLTKAADAAGLSFSAMDGLKPWFAALQLSVSYAVTQGFHPDQGVDKALESEGRADGKAIAYFEKAREQLDMFIDLPDEEQLAFLVLGAKEILERPDELKSLIGAWARGDVAAIDELMNRGLDGSPGVAKALLEDRNARWATVIRTFFLKDRNSYLIVVGAGHLAGDDSVIAMLRDAGVEVEGP